MKIILNPQPATDSNNIKPIRGKAKLVSKKQLATFVYELTFEMADPLELNFKGGQYIAVIISPTVRRQYSIASAPQGVCVDGKTFSKKHFQLVIDVKPNGVGVNYLMNLALEDEINFIGQIGLFVLPENLSKNLFFISTGTGLAPLKSMAEDLIHKNLFKNHSIKFIFGTRFFNDIFYKEIFENYLKDNHISDFKIYLSQPDKEYKGIEKGYVTEYFENFTAHDLNDSQFFICGGMNMIKSTEQLLLIKNVPQENIIYEKFY